MCFDNLGEENLKVAAFVLFPTSIIVLLEIHQSVKGHILKELRVFFKVNSKDTKTKSVTSIFCLYCYF